MKLKVNIEYASELANAPQKAVIMQWIRAALEDYEGDKVEVGVRIVDEQEITDLNERFRKESKPTNVLSFPFEDPPGIQTGLLGDVVICAPVICRQAHAQGKHESAHWAHMLVHGIMHLRGYDHRTAAQASIMEGIESRVLEQLGFPDPYA